VGWFTEHIGTPLAAKLADRVVTTAHKLKEDVISFNPNTIVIPNGVHVQKLQSFRNTEKEGKGRQAALEGFTVGFVGGFGDWVNFDIVLAAAAALPDVRFKLIGNGDRFDDVHLNAEKLENVWVPGILPYNEVLQELAVMDVCLIPFHINRITDRVSPIKLFEYWAMKKPVISTRFYEVQKIAEGKIFFIDSTDELQNVILRLQKSPDLREQMAEKGFREVAAYDWATLGQQYFQLLQTLSGTRMK
ncbi:MAG: glycosyltransferase family 4 protein, partial [bacterium]|nr:glycosyltransferase family 4 protein [bacterium]